jgi:molecular chaperone GrpE (heat shock protein)
MCDNCRRLEDRIVELKAEISELEERRSKERIQYVAESQRNFFRSLDQETTENHHVDYEQNCMDLLDLLQTIVRENGNIKGIVELREKLSKLQR